MEGIKIFIDSQTYTRYSFDFKQTISRHAKVQADKTASQSLFYEGEHSPK